MNTNIPTSLATVTSEFFWCEVCKLNPDEVNPDDVTAILAYVDHEQDEESKSALLSLKGNRFAIWDIWADYTTGHG